MAKVRLQTITGSCRYVPGLYIMSHQVQVQHPPQLAGIDGQTEACIACSLCRERMLAEKGERSSGSVPRSTSREVSPKGLAPSLRASEGEWCFSQEGEC